ncbi:WD-40 repeat-containing protein, partial [Reticulomyxa filosa]
MTTINNEKQSSMQLTLVSFESFQKLLEKKEEEIKVIIQYWIRILNVKVGWIHDFDKFVVNYATAVFMLDTFRSSSKLMNTLTGHTNNVWGIDYSTVDNNKLICSVSNDKTVRVWDVDNNKQIQLFNGHSSHTYCVKFSPYHYYTNGCNVICSSSQDRTIRFWDLKKNQQLQ